MSLDPLWTYVSVRRLTLTLQRWAALTMVGVAFEPNDITLWVRIESEVSAFLEALYEQGAFQGQSPDQAFYVKCDAETNPPAVRDLGQVVTEVGIAPARPGEFVVVRLVAGEASALGPPDGS
jgi:phage tail sheath protein FI